MKLTEATSLRQRSVASCSVTQLSSSVVGHFYIEAGEVLEHCWTRGAKLT